MGSELDQQRRAANRDAVVTFLAQKLGCDITTLGGDQEGVHFHPEATGFGRLHITDEVLTDMDSPRKLVEVLINHRVVDHLRRGTRISVTTDPATGFSVLAGNDGPKPRR